MSERGRSVQALFAVLLFFLGGILLALFGPLAWAVTWGLLLFYLAAIWGGWNIPLGGIATRIETSPSADAYASMSLRTGVCCGRKRVGRSGVYAFRENRTSFAHEDAGPEGH